MEEAPEWSSVTARVGVAAVSKVCGTEVAAAKGHSATDGLANNGERLVLTLVARVKWMPRVSDSVEPGKGVAFTANATVSA